MKKNLQLKVFYCFLICAEAKAQEQENSTGIRTGIISPCFSILFDFNIKAFYILAIPKIKEQYPDCKRVLFCSKTKEIFHFFEQNLGCFNIKTIRGNPSIEERLYTFSQEYMRGNGLFWYGIYSPNRLAARQPGDVSEKLSQELQAAPFLFDEEKQENVIFRNFFWADYSVDNCIVETKCFAYYVFVIKKGEDIRDYELGVCIGFFPDLNGRYYDEIAPTSISKECFSIPFKELFEFESKDIPKHSGWKDSTILAIFIFCLLFILVVKIIYKEPFD